MITKTIVAVLLLSSFGFAGDTLEKVVTENKDTVKRIQQESIQRMFKYLDKIKDVYFGVSQRID